MSEAVQEMFERIAPTYDLLNRVLSFGIDRGWRRRAVAALGDVRGRRVVDLCAGTLDLSAIADEAGARVTATDFAHNMLVRGRAKLELPTLRADAMRLPFADGVFAGALCGFGLRNLDDPAAGLREARRVLAPGARFVILEFFRPARWTARTVQSLYNRRVLPLVGGALSGDRRAYQYLARSIERFSTREEIEALAVRAGFTSAWGEDLTGGIASLVVAQC